MPGESSQPGTVSALLWGGTRGIQVLDYAPEIFAYIRRVSELVFDLESKIGRVALGIHAPRAEIYLLVLCCLHVTSDPRGKR
eukprot:1385126-Amorphochlora_amoeboformis.AAC.1